MRDELRIVLAQLAILAIAALSRLSGATWLAVGKWFTLSEIVFGALFVAVVYDRYLRRVSAGNPPRLHDLRVQFYSVWLAALGFVTSTVFAAFGSAESVAAIEDKVELDKKDNAFKYIERWEQTTSLDKARDLVRSRLGLSPPDPDLDDSGGLVVAIDGPPLVSARPKIERAAYHALLSACAGHDLRSKTQRAYQVALNKSVISLFNFYEEMLMSVENKRAHEDTLYTAFHDFYVGSLEVYQPWIDHHKRVNEGQFDNLLELRDRWKKRKQEERKKKKPPCE